MRILIIEDEIRMLDGPADACQTLCPRGKAFSAATSFRFTEAFEVLHYLEAKAGLVAIKEELLRAIWPDSFVDRSNLPL